MSSIIGRAAFRASRSLRAAGPTAGAINPTEAASQAQTKQYVFAQGAKRDPELYILMTIMAGAFGLAGFYFGPHHPGSLLSIPPPTSLLSSKNPKANHTQLLAPLARKPTSSSSETAVSMAPNSRPWESGTSGKYQYHPDGDRTRAPRDAPSALHSVVIPNVNLPKKLHDQFNKFDKEEFEDY